MFNGTSYTARLDVDFLHIVDADEIFHRCLMALSIIARFVESSVSALNAIDRET